MFILIKFLLPYMMFCNLAAWGLAQNLEGMGLFKYLNAEQMQFGDEVHYLLTLSATRGVNGLSALLTLMLILISLLNIRASFYLNKRVGWASLGLWCLPGVLSLLDHAPDLRRFGPDVFRFGDNFPGSTYSAAASLIICVVAGWSAILLFSTLWKKNTFKNAYDHIWYVLGLTAALYFVADNGLPSYKRDLAEADERMTRTLQLFKSGEENLQILCAMPDATKLAPDVCRIASDMKWSIQNRLDMQDYLRVQIELPGWISALAGKPELARQISMLNKWACNDVTFSKICQTVPIETAIHAKDISAPIVFPSADYAARLQRLDKSMQKAHARIHEIEQGRNTRYFVFLILAFFVGGKLANASRSIVSHDVVRPPSWVFMACKSISHLLLFLLNVLSIKVLLPLLRRLCQGGRRSVILFKTFLRKRKVPPEQL